MLFQKLLLTLFQQNKQKMQTLNAKQKVVLQNILNEASYSNCKITAVVDGKEKTLFVSIGNPSGLHSYANQLKREKWEKAKERVEKNLTLQITAGNDIKFYEYINTTRDKGSYQLNRTYKTK